MSSLLFKELGLIEYKEAWDLQEKIHSELVESKLAGRISSSQNQVLLCEHPHVYTLGKSGQENNLLINDAFLKKINASYFKTNRGGDITYHGPGQLVGYPILDLEKAGLGIRSYINLLEQSIIETLAEYNIAATRFEGATGVWLDVDKPAFARKICAIGVRVSRLVTMHGFALNVNTDLNYFRYINPCGLEQFGVTSMQKELGNPVDMAQVIKLYSEKMSRLI
jgi:lipoyl(octanoyl) transferase